MGFLVREVAIIRKANGICFGLGKVPKIQVDGGGRFFL